MRTRFACKGRTRPEAGVRAEKLNGANRRIAGISDRGLGRAQLGGERAFDTFTASSRCQARRETALPPHEGANTPAAAHGYGRPNRPAATLHKMPVSASKKALGSRSRDYHFSSSVNCPWPVGFAVHVVDFPASEAALPLATSQVPFPELVQPITLPSATVMAIFASDS